VAAHRIAPLPALRLAAAASRRVPALQGQPARSDGAPDVSRGPNYDEPTDRADEPPIEAKTLRDEFAMAALQGTPLSWRVKDGELVYDHASQAAQFAYLIADAMIEARK